MSLLRASFNLTLTVKSKNILGHEKIKIWSTSAQMERNEGKNIDEITTSDALFPFVIVRVQNRKLAIATQISQESQHFRPFELSPKMNPNNSAVYSACCLMFCKR